MLPALTCVLLSSVATGLVAPRNGATQPLGANRRLPLGAHNNDAAAAALDSFDDLASLERRLATLDEGAVPKLRGFYDAALASFALEPGVTQNFSVTSSAICIGALLDAGALDEFPAATKALAQASWRTDDLLQAPLVVSALARAAVGPPCTDRLKTAVEALLACRPHLRDWRRQKLSSYLTYWLTRALLDVADADLVEFLKIDQGAVGFALKRAFQVARDELCRQLAYDSMGEPADATRVAYSLATYASVGAARDRINAFAMRDEVRFDGDGGNRDGIEAPNLKLCARALDVFFGAQNEDGTWPPGQKIFVRSRRSFDVGNAFVFSPDPLATVLALPLPRSVFRPHVSKIERTCSWLESNDRAGAGWRSDHLEEGSGNALAWSTAQALQCAGAASKIVGELLNKRILAEFGGREGKTADSTVFDRLLNSDMDNDSLKDVIRQRIIDPRTQSCCPGLISYSAVLFGPPGTAKTTTAEAVAAALGYGFVVIDTACFLEDGLANIASRIAYVFDRLERLRDCVILFDEIEEFCLDRTTPGLGMESRILTTAMLTRLNDLRRAERSIFLVATNRLAAFDSAVVRPGRLDMLLFVGTPNLEARVARYPCGPGRETFRSFLEETWESDSRFLNYMESERFRSAALASMSEGAPFTENERLHAILGDIVRTSILRDESARDEYRDNVALTRL